MSVPPGATPRRATRAASYRAQTPLPALPTIQSHAYGAAGKTQLNGQLTSSNAEVDAAFTTTKSTRKACGSTAKAQTPAPPAETTTRGRKSKKRADPEPVPEEDGVDEPNGILSNGPAPAARENGFRPNTRLEPDLTYDDMITSTPKPAVAPKEPSPSPPPPEQPSHQSPVPEVEAPARAAPQAEIRAEDVEPWKIQVAFWTAYNYLVPSTKLISTLWMGFVLVSGFLVGLAFWISLIPLPTKWATARDSAYSRVKVVFYGPEAAAQSIENIPANQAQINQLAFARVDTIYDEVRGLKETTGLHGETLREIQRILPSHLAMTSNGGEWQLSTTFWTALAEKMASDAATPLWDKFLEDNHDRVHQAWMGSLRQEVNGVIEDMEIITQEQLQHAVVQNNDYMQTHHNDTLNSFRAHILKESRGIAEEVTNHALENLPHRIVAKVQLRSLALSTIIENSYRLIHQTNYLSIGLGALVVPAYTSPTYKNPLLNQGWVDRFLYRLGVKTLDLEPFVPTLPPTAALRDWKEGAECWCAAPSDDEKGMAQLAIQFPYKIYPGDFYLEHVPATGTRDIAAAPNTYEVWAQVDNATEATRLGEALDREIPDHYDFACGSPPKPNSDRWVCILHHGYSIHLDNWIQLGQLLFSPERVGLTTKMVAFRAVSNWGSTDHTCIYRVRMTGKEVVKEEDFD